MTFVFVSHANTDKKRVRHIVDALISANIKVWMDNPLAAGYSADEVRAHFHRIKAGTSWKDEIEDALRDARLVIVCFSEAFKEPRREVFREEAIIARQGKKLVGCRVDDVDPTTLPYDFGKAEIKDLRQDLPDPGGARTLLGQVKRLPRIVEDLDAALQLFVEDLRARLHARNDDLARNRQHQARDPFLPFLVDRTDQEESVEHAIEEIAKTGGVRPFFVAGPENECLLEFRDRLERHAIPRRLKGPSWQALTVEWPDKQPLAKFGSLYQRRLADALGLSSAASQREIAAKLADLQIPAAPLSFLSPTGFKQDTAKRIEAWLEFWRELEAEKLGFAAVPMVWMKFPKAEPGWENCPPGRAVSALFSNDQIWAIIESLGREHQKPGWFGGMFGGGHQGCGLEIPPMLHPISDDHVSAWTSKHLNDATPGERAEVMSVWGKICTASKCGSVSLQDFAKTMGRVLDGSLAGR